MSGIELTLLIVAVYLGGMAVGWAVGIQSKRPPKPRKHQHVWGKWVRYKTVRIWEGSRDNFQGYEHLYERTCSGCGDEQHQVKEATL